jgi:hypothetical protein
LQTTSVNDCKLLKPGLDWKKSLFLSPSSKFKHDDESKKPSEATCFGRGCLVVHDIFEDAALYELLTKVSNAMF